jgi:hypothetical protein
MNQNNEDTILDSNLENPSNETNQKPIPAPSFPWSALLFLVLGLVRIGQGSTGWGGFLLIYGIFRLGYYAYESSKYQG